MRIDQDATGTHLNHHELSGNVRHISHVCHLHYKNDFVHLRQPTIAMHQQPVIETNMNSRILVHSYDFVDHCARRYIFYLNMLSGDRDVLNS